MFALSSRDAAAQDYRLSLSLRSGYTFAPEWSTLGSSASASLVGMRSLGRRLGVVAALGYRPSALADPGGVVPAFFLQSIERRTSGVLSVGFGIRYRLGDLDRNPYLPFLELVPTLFYGRRRKEVLPGFELNLALPFRLSPHLNLETGIGYIYSGRAEDHRRDESVQHFQAFGSLTYGS